MTAALQSFSNANDATALMVLLSTHGAPAQLFRRLASAFAGEVLHLTDDDRCRLAIETAASFADGRADATELAKAHDAAHSAFVASKSGIQAMSRVAAVNAAGTMVTPVGLARAAASAAVRAAEAAQFANSDVVIEVNQVAIIRATVSVDAFRRLVAGAQTRSANA